MTTKATVSEIQRSTDSTPSGSCLDGLVLMAESVTRILDIGNCRRKPSYSPALTQQRRPSSQIGVRK